MSPCSNATTTSSPGCGSMYRPRSLPALTVATRAHQPSMLSPSAGNFTRTRPILSGSLLLVTMPMTSDEAQSASRVAPQQLGERVRRAAGDHERRSCSRCAAAVACASSRASTYSPLNWATLVDLDRLAGADPRVAVRLAVGLDERAGRAGRACSGRPCRPRSAWSRRGRRRRRRRRRAAPTTAARPSMRVRLRRRPAASVACPTSAWATFGSWLATVTSVTWPIPLMPRLERQQAARLAPGERDRGARLRARAEVETAGRRRRNS